MPITNDGPSIDPTLVIINRADRQRREISIDGPHGDGLLESIKARGGLINPIVIKRSNNELVAGERRLSCYLKLKWPLIPVRYLDELSELEAMEIEFDENAHRTDITWQESAQAVDKYHRARRLIDTDWTQAETGDKLGIAQSLVSVYVRAVSEFNTMPKVALASGINEAINIIRRKEQRNSDGALDDILGVTNEISPMEDMTSDISTMPVGQAERTIVAEPNAGDAILNQSFLEWAPKYKGRKFNLIHCDFPYGIEFNKGPQSGEGRYTTYDDTADTYFKLLECFCLHLDKFMAINAHLMFWYSAKRRRETEDMFAKLAPSLVFYPYDLIWTKSDNAGIAADPRRHPRHVYETCMLAYRGGRNVVQIVGDSFAAPTDKKWHPSTKPEPMLRHFFQMLVDESTTMFDPTCGSGSSLRAAESLGAVKTLGLEIEPEHCDMARIALKQFRTLRMASREI